MSEVLVKKGAIHVYRIFDIAEEINMSKVEQLLRDSRGPDRFMVPRYIDRAIIVKSLPVSFHIGEVTLSLKTGSYKADVLVKVRDYGVLSIIYQIQIAADTEWSELIRIAASLEEGTEIDQLAAQQAKEVKEALLPALKQPNDWKVFEDYIIYFLQELSEPNVDELLKRADIPSLLLAEDDTVISAKTRDLILENIHRYSESDCAIVEWNSAFVLEPKGSHEIPDILEFALTHLLEMRYYDELLDNRLGILYDEIEHSKGRPLRGSFAQTYQDASSRYIEFCEFIERVENSLKVVGDFYLATVYRSANRRFRLSDWQQNITRKMNILAQVSSLLQGEVNMRRSHLLEITVVLMIAFEIISAVLHWFH